MNQKFKNYFFWSLGFSTLGTIIGMWPVKFIHKTESISNTEAESPKIRAAKNEIDPHQELSLPHEQLMVQAAQVLSTGPEPERKPQALPFAERLGEKTQIEQEAYDKKASEIQDEIRKFYALKDELNQAIMDQRGPHETASLNESFEKKARYILMLQGDLNQLYQNLARAYDNVIKSVTDER